MESLLEKMTILKSSKNLCSHAISLCFEVTDKSAPEQIQQFSSKINIIYINLEDVTSWDALVHKIKSRSKSKSLLVDSHSFSRQEQSQRDPLLMNLESLLKGQEKICILLGIPPLIKINSHSHQKFEKYKAMLEFSGKLLS